MRAGSIGGWDLKEDCELFNMSENGEELVEEEFNWGDCGEAFMKRWQGNVFRIYSRRVSAFVAELETPKHFLSQCT